MRLRHAIWQKLQPSPASPKTLDMVALAEQLGQLPQLQRKPWVILNDCRADFESAMGLSTDALLMTLASWLEDACVGLAHVSGNVYLGLRLDLGARSLAPEQVLLGNLFSHGEIGLDAIASPKLHVACWRKWQPTLASAGFALQPRGLRRWHRACR